MKIISRVAILPFVLLAFGCKGPDSKTNDALNSDLSLAAQAHPVTPADSVSAIERAHANAVAERSGATHHAVTPYYRSGASAAPAPTTSTVRNTKRDAAIGAGAGAVLGAVTSKNKVRGGVIGGVAGGILGAILGNNVDTKKVSHP
ncbi:MAG: YMGG-like glycine zipper-containing protein [Gemmatimonadaceae bacterium]